jgi:hypothetical protein
MAYWFVKKPKRTSVRFSFFPATWLILFKQNLCNLNIPCSSIKSTIAFIALLLSASNAFAQSTQPSNIDDRFRSQLRNISETERQNALLSGNNDIVLLRKAKLWTLSGAMSATQSDNAGLSPIDAESDTFGNAQVNLHFGTRIAGRVNVFADIGAVGVRYKKFNGLDYSALTGSVGAEATLKGVDLSLVYQPSIVFDRAFVKRQLTQHRTTATIARPFTIKGIRFEPSLSADRVISNPSDFESWGYGGNLTTSFQLSRRIPLSAYANYGFERRQYDHYFVDFLGVDRNDRQRNFSLGINYNFARNGNLSLSYDYVRNRSTSDVNEYEAKTGGIRFELRMQF